MSITLATLLLVLPSAVRDGAPLFVDVSEDALPGVSTLSGSPDKSWIMEVNGGGIVLADFDGDSDIDLVIVDGSTVERAEAGKAGKPPRLFQNDGNGNFTAAGEAWSMSGGRWGTGGAAGDVNGDGFPDLVVTQWGQDRLFLNEAGKGFREVTETAGFVGERWGTSAAFMDFDGDARLDLVVINYLAFDTKAIGRKGSAGCQWKGHDVMCGPEGLVPVHDQLYRGNGDGTFEEVSAKTGFRADRAGFGLGVMTLDYDSDGDTDVYVTNDSTPNYLWENQGDGSFLELGFERGVARDSNGKEQAGMGIACADWNQDGRGDLFVTNFSGEANALYRSSRKTGFRERSARVGLGGPSLTRLGWGTGFGDFDLDGHLDLYVMNGHVYPAADMAGTDTSYAQPDYAFFGDGTSFDTRALYAGPDRCSRAAAMADLDHDGDFDLIALAVEGPVRVLRNECSNKGHWLELSLIGTRCNREAIGARVEIINGERRRWAEMRTSGGYQSSVPARVHFGLGELESVDQLIVHWPNGEVTVTGPHVANQRLTIIQPPIEEEGAPKNSDEAREVSPQNEPTSDQDGEFVESARALSNTNDVAGIGREA
jgi:hypothetical protein